MMELTRQEALKMYEETIGDTFPNEEQYSDFNIEEIFAGCLGLDIEIVEDIGKIQQDMIQLRKEHIRKEAPWILSD